MATDLAKLTVRLEAQSSKLQRDLDKANASLKRFEGQADRVGRRVKDSLSNAFRGLGALAGAAGITNALRSVIGEAEKAERAMFKLEQIVKVTGSSAGLTAEQIDEFSRNLALSTLASVEGVQDAAGALLTFRNISGDTFKETLTLAQDLTAVFGTDLRQNAIRLGKALQDPAKGFSALTENGISFTESQKELINSLQESGNLLGAQALILEEVRNQVGGTGTSEAGGLSGAVDTLAQNWDAFLENIGNAGPIQAAKGLIDGLATRVRNLNNLLFDSEREQFDKLIERRRELQRQIEKIESFQGTPTGLIRQVEEIDKQIRVLQDKNIQRIKDEAEAERGAEAQKAEIRRQAEEARASAETEAAKKRSERLTAIAEASAQREAEAYTRSLQNLIDTIDPAGREARELEESINLLNLAMSRGDIGPSQYAFFMRELTTNTEAATRAQEQLIDTQERASDLIKSIDPVADIRDQILQVQELREALEGVGDAYSRALAEGLSDVEFELQNQLQSVVDGLGEINAESENTKSVWESLGTTFSSAFEDAIVAGKGFKDVLKGLEQDILRIFSEKLITEPLTEALGPFFGASGGGGNFLSSLFGFANGGSFIVGGAGGTDSQLVAFRATPGERVEVKTPQQQGAQSVVNNFSFMLPSDNVDHRRSAQIVAREAARFIQLSQGAV